MYPDVMSLICLYNIKLMDWDVYSINMLNFYTATSSCSDLQVSVKGVAVVHLLVTDVVYSCTQYTV